MQTNLEWWNSRKRVFRVELDRQRQDKCDKARENDRAGENERVKGLID